MSAPITVRRVTDPSLLADFLDRARDAYMVGDLAEPYWSDAEFFGAFEMDGAVEKLVTVAIRYTPINPPPVILAGSARGAEPLYREIAKTSDQIFYHAQAEHIDALNRVYAPVSAEHMPMYRMICTPNRFTLPPNADDTVYARLTALDLPRMREKLPAPSALPDNWVFYGAEVDGALVAMSGTHIVSPSTGIGVVGWVFTHPDYRGQGLAAGCTARVTDALFRQGLTLVALNVRQDNPPAIRAYERCGFRIHNELFEGEATRRIATTGRRGVVQIERQVTYSDPISFRRGEPVRVTEKRDLWNGTHLWIWCVNHAGKEGWVPAPFLDVDGAVGTGKQDYSAAELSIYVGEPLIVLYQILMNRHD